MFARFLYHPPVADEPFFPPPKPRGAMYREPQERPITTNEDEPHGEAKPIVVSRPDESPPASKKSEQLDQILSSTGDEHSCWASQGFAARHPRIAGAILAVPGVFFSSLVLEATRHKVYVRGFMIGPSLLAVGLYFVIAGMPIDARTGRVAAWWPWGLAVATFAGLLATIAILLMR